MENLAPNIKRQRLLIEGYFDGDCDKNRIKQYFSTLCSEMNFTAYGDPTIFSPQGMGKEENQGFDAFLPLIDSGISLYVWSSSKFFSIIIYTCKDFNSEQAVLVTKEFWSCQKSAHIEF